MKGIEQLPFRGNFHGFDSKSYDSVAGLLRFKTTEEESIIWKKNVIKWNKHELSTFDQAQQAAIFKQRSIELYQSALGVDYLVPTSIVVGNKRDITGLKYKVFQVQPYVDAWTGRDAPNEVKDHPSVLAQWDVLSERLSNLYVKAGIINSQVPELNRFPITLTVGDSRQKASAGIDLSQMPVTKNLFIDKLTKRLSLFDFGEYAIWRDTMVDTYQKIFEQTRISEKREIFNQREVSYLQHGKELVQELVNLDRHA